MLIHTVKLRSAFEKAKAIKEHKDLYCLDPKRIPVSVEDVQWVVQDMTGIEIEKFEVTTTSSVTYVRGILERYSDKRARILIRSNQSEDGKRYTCVKELCHIAIDEVEDLSTRGHETIEQMIEERTLERVLDERGDTDDPEGEFQQAAPANAIQSEKIAEIIATEILYPYEFRSQDLEDLASGKATHASLALHYKVPGVVVQQALAPNYRKFADEFWGHINQTDKNA